MVVKFGTNGPEKISGGSADDTLYGWDAKNFPNEGGPADDDDQLFGGEGNDVLYGGNGLDKLFGDEGSNLLYGGDMNDLLISEGVDDTLFGGAGDDLLRVRNPGSALFAYGDEGIDTLDMYLFALNTAQNLDLRSSFGTVGSLTYAGIEQWKIIVGDENDRVIGGAGNDFFQGLGGSDTLHGGAGDDTISVLGGGSHRLNGGEGTDVLLMDFSNLRAFESVTVSGRTDGSIMVLPNGSRGAGFEKFDFRGGAGPDSLTGGVWDDSLTGGHGNDTLTGRQGADILNGGSGQNTLFGGNGADTLIVGDGSGPYRSGSVLFGGEGADRFEIWQTPDITAVATIRDFDSATEAIHLKMAAFSGLAANESLQTQFFRQGRAALDADDRFVYRKITGELFYDADGNGAGAAQLYLKFNPDTVVKAEDLILF